MSSAPPPLPNGQPDYDVILIGGGINGTGVARDLALRGLKVAVFEKNDLAYGASGNNSGMIHGGPRYLLDHPEVTEESCRDSGNIQKIAQNLLFRVPFLLVVPGEKKLSRLTLTAFDAYFSYYDEYQKLKRGKKHAVLSASEARSIEPGITGDIAGAIVFDEWGVDGARLCVLNAIDAQEHGAKFYLHHEVDGLIGERRPEGGFSRIFGVSAYDTDTGARVTATARIVINATGAWGPITAALSPNSKARVRQTKGIHVVYDRRLSNYGVMCSAVDDRQIFLMPWGDVSWIGTTDDDFYGDLDQIRSTTDEVRYLVQGIASVMPSVRDARIIATTVGVRPTLYEYGPLEDKLSREHDIVDHGAREGVRGLYSMIGGKLASYRLFAQEMSDLVAKQLDVRVECSTHTSPLPGHEALVESRELADKYGISEIAAKRLAQRHGTRSHVVLGRSSTRKDDNEVVCACEPVLACEIRHAVREEGARDLEDVARRTRLGWGACGGMKCAHRAAQIVCEERKLNGGDGRSIAPMAAKFLIKRYRSRVPGIGTANFAHEEAFSASLAYGGVPQRMQNDGGDE